MTKLVIGGLLLVLACGGDSEDTEEEEPMQETETVREGPVGCYFPARFMCDCELSEEQCTGADRLWTEGCMSCAAM